ncbi:MAG: MarC family protein [Chloroflexota bacterium]
MLAGPATLATLILLADSAGYVIAVLALVINLLIAWRLFRRASTIARLFGSNGLRATSKVASLLLAAIAIKFIREGILTILYLPTT